MLTAHSTAHDWLVYERTSERRAVRLKLKRYELHEHEHECDIISAIMVWQWRKTWHSQLVDGWFYCKWWKKWILNFNIALRNSVWNGNHRTNSFIIQAEFEKLRFSHSPTLRKFSNRKMFYSIRRFGMVLFYVQSQLICTQNVESVAVICASSATRIEFEFEFEFVMKIVRSFLATILN